MASTIAIAVVVTVSVVVIATTIATSAYLSSTNEDTTESPKISSAATELRWLVDRTSALVHQRACLMTESSRYLGSTPPVCQFIAQKRSHHKSKAASSPLRRVDQQNATSPTSRSTNLLTPTTNHVVYSLRT
ncbi:hypothetical protein EG327_001902 [Venturia inaequalis]|uniref:Uncharacterized protein n=1 Tax=Venturia inaequalis TaxID=5025 RepID=A0A8H3U5U4_VENIN|nr:hypothetical protein EG327_001902 [Venturia inaequalis]